VWFGNNLICDPSYPAGIRRCMGTASVNDLNGLTDGPSCSTSTSPVSSSTVTPSSTSSVSSTVTPSSTSAVSSTVTPPSTSVVSFSVTFSKFPNAQIVRVQYKVQNAKGQNWSATTVDGTKTTAAITGLLPNTIYEYRFIVINLDGTRPPVGPTLTFKTPSS